MILMPKDIFTDWQLTIYMLPVQKTAVTIQKLNYSSFCSIYWIGGGWEMSKVAHFEVFIRYNKVPIYNTDKMNEWMWIENSILQVNEYA